MPHAAERARAGHYARCLERLIAGRSVCLHRRGIAESAERGPETGHYARCLEHSIAGRSVCLHCRLFEGQRMLSEFLHCCSTALLFPFSIAGPLLLGSVSPIVASIRCRTAWIAMASRPRRVHCLLAEGPLSVLANWLGQRGAWCSRQRERCALRLALFDAHFRDVSRFHGHGLCVRREAHRCNFVEISFVRGDASPTHCLRKTPLGSVQIPIPVRVVLSSGNPNADSPGGQHRMASLVSSDCAPFLTTHPFVPFP